MQLILWILYVICYISLHNPRDDMCPGTKYTNDTISELKCMCESRMLFKRCIFNFETASPEMLGVPFQPIPCRWVNHLFLMWMCNAKCTCIYLWHSEMREYNNIIFMWFAWILVWFTRSKHTSTWIYTNNNEFPEKATTNHSLLLKI